MKRRDFFTRGFPAYVFKMSEMFVETAGLVEEEKKDYFDSFESCYPLLNEAPYDMLVDAANKLGISIEGRKNRVRLQKNQLMSYVRIQFMLWQGLIQFLKGIIEDSFKEN